MTTQIGTVEILKARVYPLDAVSLTDERQQVWVEPGVYPVYKDYGAIFWIMTGVLSYGSGMFRKIGDGMFLVNSEGDERSDVEVKFPSRRFGEDQFKTFLRSDLAAREGHPDQRLRFRLGEVIDG
jgi:hypothetical protein